MLLIPFLNDYFDIETVIKLMISHSINISSHAISLCNNYIATKMENKISFKNHNGLAQIMYIIENSSFQAKVEAGFLLITYFSDLSYDEILLNLSFEIIESISSLIFCNDFQLQFSILKFLIEMATNYHKVVDYLNECSFHETLEDIMNQDNELSELSNNLHSLITLNSLH